MKEKAQSNFYFLIHKAFMRKYCECEKMSIKTFMDLHVLSTPD
jgi:hypothetical protein